MSAIVSIVTHINMNACSMPMSVMRRNFGIAALIEANPTYPTIAILNMLFNSSVTERIENSLLNPLIGFSLLNFGLIDSNDI
ncbi:MAG: hypothetical protein BWY28_03205 [bacterium ADurb.Bin236]|nr:MAG: hypothetical protein BWY28_03205 [bacterium ADurb.Bin236]